MIGEKVLLIDDDRTLLELLSDHVKAAGYKPVTAHHGQKGVKIALEVEPALVILDIMMPGMDGWEVCRLLREKSSVPIIMLTAKGEEFDKLRGFRLGVDDYVTKPFSFAELIARIGAVLGRASYRDAPVQTITTGALSINLQQREVTLAGKRVALTPTEFRLLAALAQRPHRTVPTEQILLEVWGEAYGNEVEHVKHYIWALRKKIEEDPGDPKHIITDWGYGYRFE